MATAARKAANQRWREKNPEARRAIDRRARIKYLYGITVEEYESKLSMPCAICAAPSKVMDHSHATGALRAGLCQACNIGLGQFKDDPERLRRAAAYLG